MRGRDRLVIGALLLAAGCGSEPWFRYAAPPWPVEHTVVLVGLDAAGQVVTTPELFAPGAAVQAELTDRVERLLALTFEDGDGALARCGVAVGGSFPPLPRAALAFSADDLRSDARFELEPTSQPLDLGLHFATCAPATPTCPTMRLTELPSPLDKDVSVRAMAAHAGTLFVSPNGDDVSHQLYRLESGTFEPVPLPAPVGRGTSGFRTMASGDGLWVTQNRQVYALAADFTVATSTEAPFFVQRLDVEADGGPVIATADDDGVGGVFDATGQTPTIEVPGNGAVLEGPDHRFLLLRYAVLRWVDGAWDVERPLEELEAYSVLGGDREVVAAADALGRITIRGDEGLWANHAAVDGAAKSEVVLHLGEGRILFAGRGGFAALWTGARWCPIERRFANDFVSGALFEGRAYLGGGDIDTVSRDQPPIVRLDFEPADGS